MDENNKSSTTSEVNGNGTVAAAATFATPDMTNVDSASVALLQAKIQQLEAQNKRQREEISRVISCKGKEIARRDEVISHQGKEISRRDEVISHQGKEIARRDEVISCKGKEISRRDEVISHQGKENFHNSYDDMVKRFAGLPDIMPKRAELKFHEHAGFAENSMDQKFVTDDDLNFNINSKDKTTGYAIKSSLLERFPLEENPDNKDGPKVLVYRNEATVADYVQDVVIMCLKSLGYFDNSRLCKEMSLFSLRPDLILVKHKTEGIILIIEVKMPGENLFESPGIAKQVADYLVLQHRLGNNMPFVLLSSYREACLCRLKPGCVETDNVGGVEGDYRGIVEEAAKLLKEGKVLLNILQGSESDHKSKAKDHSPEKISFRTDEMPTSLLRVSKQNKRRRLDRHERPMIKIISPKVVYSRPFHLKNMMHGVSLAIVCGLLSLNRTTRPEKSQYWPPQMSLIDGLHPQVESGKLNWVQVQNMRIDYITSPLRSKGTSAKKYILLQEIGRGKSGKVFLAVDHDGTACALKFFLDDEAENHHAHGQRDEQCKALLEKNMEAAAEEASRWQELQKGYTDYVAHMELNNRAVLQMPVFAPVPVKERVGVLENFQTLLTEFFNKGYFIKEVRWQHVGCRQGEDNKLELALLDLESLLDLKLLKKLGPNELAKEDLGPLHGSDINGIDREALIASQIEELKKKHLSEPPTGGATGLLPPT